MDLSSITLPHTAGFDFGVGVDRLTGAAKNLVVKPEATPVDGAQGAVQSFEVSRITSTSDLQKKLGLDIEASYGCAAFGAGASARFSFAQESKVHTASLFLAITASVRQPDLSIDNVLLTDDAAPRRVDAGGFTTMYGDMFCRSSIRGGLYVAVMRVDTRTSQEANSIEAELQGSYGLFSAEAAVSFSEVVRNYDASVYCNVYAEGGPPIQLQDPTDQAALLANANAWMQAMINEPERYSRPYQWVLAPNTIAAGPLGDAASVEHAQDVLLFCARERTELLDELNILDWIRQHPENFSWAGTAVTLAAVTTAWRSTQADLDILARCAAAALADPASARMPAPFASASAPPALYRGAPTPAPLPIGRARPVPAGNQAGWRYCVTCGVMFYDGYADNKGQCPGGGGHRSAGYNFWLAHAAYVDP